MSLSKQVDDFTKLVQDFLQTKQTKVFDAEAQKLSDEVNKKFKSWKSKPSMILTSIQKFRSEHSKFKLKDIQFQIMENHPDKTDPEVD